MTAGAGALLRQVSRRELDLQANITLVFSAGAGGRTKRSELSADDKETALMYPQAPSVCVKMGAQHGIIRKGQLFCCPARGRF
jgi:hypothetical protein